MKHNNAKDDLDDDEFEDEESGGFDNAFNYNKDEFKSEISDSYDQPPVVQTQQNTKDNVNQFTINKNQPSISNPFTEKALIQTTKNVPE